MASRVPSRMDARSAPSTLDINNFWPTSPDTNPKKTWLVLTRDVSTPNFTEGTFVVITEQLEATISPGGDDSVFIPSQDTVQYKFKTLITKHHTFAINTPISGPDMVKLNMVSDRRGGRPRPEGGVPFEDGAAVYLIEQIPPIRHRSDGISRVYVVPNGLCVRVSSKGSHNGKDKLLANPSRHAGALRYILDVFIQKEQKEWRDCRTPLGHHAFRLPRGDELRKIQKLEEQPEPPHVVPYVPDA